MTLGIYTDDVLGDAMEVFDRLPKRVRDQLNDGVLTQLAEDMRTIERVLQRRGEAEVLRLLHEADRNRKAGLI